MGAVRRLTARGMRFSWETDGAKTEFRFGNSQSARSLGTVWLPIGLRGRWFLVVRGMVRKRIPKKRSNFSSLDFDGARSRGAAAARSPDGSPKAPGYPVPPESFANSAPWPATNDKSSLSVFHVSG